MSVFVFDRKEIAETGETIRTNQNLRNVFLNPTERLERELYHCRAGKDLADLDNAIKCFVDRLYIANQLAYYYQYPDEGEGDKMSIKRLDEGDFRDVMPLRMRGFVDKAKLLRYNLFTNNGRSFLGREDVERFDRLIDHAKEIIIFPELCDAK